MKLSRKEIDCTLELKKHVNLIHCSNSFSLVQRKLFNALLFNAYPRLVFENQFMISAKTLCNIIGYKSNDYKSLKKALLGLMTIAIEWNVIGNKSHENNEKWRASSALSCAKLEKGICTYEYSSIMKELFYQPEIYGRIDIGLLPKFKSSYGLALYENCIRYTNVPQTPWFPLDVFRKLMGVAGDKYVTFRDFKKRVLDIAVKEVNLHSSITVFPDFKRIGRKMASIRFLIDVKRKDENSVLNLTDKSSDLSLFFELKEKFNLSEKIIKDLLSTYEEKYIHEKKNLILNSESFRSGRIRGLAGYLIEALRKDYKKTKSSREIVREKLYKKEIEEFVNKQEIERLKNEYGCYLRSMIDSFLSNVSAEDISILNIKFELTLKEQGGYLYKWHKNKGLNHPAVRAAFNNFILETSSEKFKNIISLEEYIQTNQHQMLGKLNGRS